MQHMKEQWQERTTQASELFQICMELTMADPSGPAILRMHELLVLASAEACRQRGGTFGNLFSQIDWACKHLGIGYEDTRSIQTARRHSNSREPLSAEDWHYDLRAVALFVSKAFRADIPGSLLQRLPAINKPREKGLTVNKNYVRCIVRRFDDRTIEADSDDGSLVADYANTADGRNLGYLKKVLREGMQLNLLDCHVEEGTPVRVIPTLVVVEPDFLMDVSSLAACFTPYGHHPLLYTLNRLKPAANTQAVLLGNLAGEVLDEQINGAYSDLDTTLQRAFRREPLRYMACQDYDDEKFRTQAANQVVNIRQAVAEMKRIAPSSQFLLEPSFVCERLGLQGRVDLMTGDMQLLVEQKSGKNMKIEHQSHDAYGMQREDHYVQLLLYYGILHYNFGKTDRQVDTRLLYSRYPMEQGLVAVNYYRALFREAIKLRNQLVATEFLIARNGFDRILPLLTTDVIYKDVVHDGFFHRYIQPQTDSLTTHFSHLTALERAYFCRMMTFVYREQLCQKLGVVEGESGCTADLWQMPLGEKQETGNIYLGLTLGQCEKSEADGGYDLLTLDCPPPTGGSAPSNFRRGDMVYLYRYVGTPDVRKSILYKGTMQEVTSRRLVVLLNNGQRDAQQFIGCGPYRWAIEHGGSDVGTNSQIRGLFQFATSPADRRQLLLGQRVPKADTTLSLLRSYHPNYDEVLLKIRQSRDYFLLVGPPGTGKTSMALRFMVEEELPLLPSSAALLLMAYTNRAVDEICGMLTKAGHDYLRLGNAASCDPQYQEHLFQHRIEKGDALAAGIGTGEEGKPRIIVATTATLQSQPYIFQMMHFSLAIVDEASQILEPGIVGLLSRQEIDRFVLVGDHKQLPAVVQQSAEDALVSDQLLNGIGIRDCRQSLFERLYRWELAQGRSQFIGTLDRQGRMHPDVALFPSSRFYAGEHLQVVPLPHQEQPSSLDYQPAARDELDALLKTQRMLFIPVVPTAPRTSPKSNVDEARVVADLLLRVCRFYGNRFDPQTTVGVIVPYRNQIAAIQQAIDKRLTDPSLQDTPARLLKDVSIDTVERYQGSQREVIIYSFTVSRYYQLDFLSASTTDDGGVVVDRKLNVALTRARQQMLMVGNPEVLGKNRMFQQLIADYSKKKTGKDATFKNKSVLLCRQ